MKNRFKNEDYLVAILDCPICNSDYCFEEGNNEESAVVCHDCGFEVVTNNVAKSKKKWNEIKR